MPNTITICRVCSEVDCSCEGKNEKDTIVAAVRVRVPADTGTVGRLIIVAEECLA